MATRAALEPATNSLEGYEETLYYQRPVILFRSENWPIAQLKYHRTPQGDRISKLEQKVGEIFLVPGRHVEFRT